MPDPKDDAKRTADTHQPDREETDPAAADATDIEGTPGRGENQAGFLKDRDGMGSGRGGKEG